MRRSLAAVVILASLAASPGGAQVTSQTVSGRVVDARDQHPLAHATVTLRQNRSPDQAVTTATDSEGSFRFEAVPPGRYNLFAAAPRHLPASYLQHEQFSTAIVTGEGLPTEKLTLQLSAMARIEGRILDEAGEPVSKASVSLYSEYTSGAGERMHVAQRVMTGDNGEYEFNRLAAGRYFIEAQGQPWYAVYPSQQAGQNYMYREAIDPQLNVAYLPIFYPAATDERGAEPIDLKAGDELRADMQFQPVPALTITVPSPADANGGRRLPSLVRSLFGQDDRLQTQYRFSNDAVTLVGVPPGRYRVEESRLPGQGRPAPRVVEVGTSSVTLVPSSDLEEDATIEFAVAADPGAALPKNININLRKLDGEWAGSLNTQGKDTRSIEHVAPGDYRVVFVGDTRIWHVSTVEVNGKPQPDRMLHIKNSGTIHAAITVTNFSARVEGVAKHGDALAVGTMMVLVPDGPDTSESLFRRDQTDLDGGFSFASVAPGQYHVVAIDDGWTLRWSDIPALAKYLPQSEAVTVRGNGPADIKLADPVQAQPR
jgi:protocatechuate 3,4-dioxygenase beta subunit